MSTILPDEVLLRVFQHLSHQEILHCRLLSRSFCDLIQSSSVLRYIVELALHGKTDGRSKEPYTTAQRLKLLEDNATAWRDLKWTRREEVSITGDSLYELSGGMIARSKKGENATMSFLRLPSRIAPFDDENPATNHELDISIHDFTLDPEQDLLALIENKPVPSFLNSKPWNVHLRTISTNEPHPLASHPILDHGRVLNPTAQNPEFAIQIMGDVLGLLVGSSRHTGGYSRLVVWKWTTGVVLSVMNSVRPLTSFIFLSDHHFVITLTNDDDPSSMAKSAWIEVYDFEAIRHIDPSEAFDEDVPHPVHVASFYLPEPNQGTLISSLMSRSDPQPPLNSQVATSRRAGTTVFHDPYVEIPQGSTRMPPKAFVPAERRLLVFTFVNQWEDQWFINTRQTLVLTYSTTLLSLLEPLHLNDTFVLEDPKPPKIIVWEEWGASGARLLHDALRANSYVTYVYGDRFAMVDTPTDIDEEEDEDEDEMVLQPKPKTRILDFNPLLVKRLQLAAKEDRETSTLRGSFSEDDEDAETEVSSDKASSEIPSKTGWLPPAELGNAIIHDHPSQDVLFPTRPFDAFEDPENIESALPFIITTMNVVFPWLSGTMIDDDHIITRQETLVTGTSAFEVFTM